MKIKDIRTSIHSVPVEMPLIGKIDMYGRGEAQTLIFCEVETDEGITGVSLVAHQMSKAVESALTSRIFPMVKDMDPRDLEAIQHKIWMRANLRATTGVTTCAISALDIALWDIAGKKEGRTVAELMGGHKKTLPAYVTFGLASYDQDQLVEAAKLQLANGFTGFKMVVAERPGGWREDAKRVRAVRDAIGEDCDLMIDANMHFSPTEARYLCRAVADCNLTWFEEPLWQNDARALADLRKLCGIPLVAGQNEGHRWRLRELVVNESVDMLQPSVLHCGGYTEARKVAFFCQTYNMRLAAGGGWPHFNMHLMAGVMNGWNVEWHLGSGGATLGLFPDAPRPIDGMITIADLPGLGLVPDRDRLKDTLVK
jgi:L-alanine-DL-glutamate epimerase-like enolase superfamily enzyme